MKRREFLSAGRVCLTIEAALDTPCIGNVALYRSLPA
jgi:hypothetical protein